MILKINISANKYAARNRIYKNCSKRLQMSFRKKQNTYFTVIENLKENPFNKKLDVKKLKTSFEGYRVRKGSFRILFEKENKIITIYSIKHRKDAYKK